MEKILPFLIVLLLLGTTAARAQQQPSMPMLAGAALPVAAKAGTEKAGVPAAAQPAAVQTPAVQSVAPLFRGSFFLTPLEIEAIEQALQGNVIKSQALAAANAPIPPHRVIRLSGVYYRSPQDWVVWMNGQKVTPKDLLPQIVSIHVSPSSQVRLKWYDVGLNKVLALTLRPDQTYDITTGILLPGAH
ncbi:MAG: hypothetical protein KGL10_00995 [Alphaproteobacteria bacterium]|nr:hypothetical protein [Alphaproteobacteria bacterium]MDE2335867.1 hypothetical protein [Alphaproteobacteria bacterium]